jgi:hypothetical protein
MPQWGEPTGVQTGQDEPDGSRPARVQRLSPVSLGLDAGRASRAGDLGITDPRFAPMELHAIVTNFAVQVVPIMKKGTEPYRGDAVGCA